MFLLLLVGCASAPPPPPVSDLRQQAARAETSARQEYLRRNWSAAALLFERAANQYGVLDDFEARASALHNQGQALRQDGRLDAALEAYEQALALNEEAGRLARQAENLDGIAQCQAARSQWDPAIQTLETALALAADAPTVMATLQNDLALVLLRRRHLEDETRIFELLNAALRANEARRTTPYVAATRLNLGRAHVEFGQLDPAEEQLTMALAQFRTVDDALGMAHAHEALGHLYATRGNAQRAAHHFQLARDKFAFLKDETGLRRVESAGR